MKTIKALRFSFRRSALHIAALLAACALPATAAAATIHGNTDGAVVWISLPNPSPSTEVLTMTNHFRSFIPPYIVIPVGASIQFPNDDPFYHSIYSDSSVDRFDIGYYGPGPGKAVPFPKPGIVEVHCHIHAYMHATIIVADGPFSIVSGGTYALSGVPAGTFGLHVWNPKRGERTRRIVVPANEGNVRLDVRW